MAEKKDYYEILGINKNVSKEEIKKAYRKMALQWHPDRAAPEKKKEAEERFKEISESYAVLSDDTKRAQYDRFGHTGIDSRYSTEDLFRGVDFGDLFDSFGFGNLFGDSVFGDLFGSGRGRGVSSRGRDAEYRLRISLRDAALGKEVPVTVSHMEACSQCRGSGMKPGTKKKACSQCKGRGEVRYAQGFFSISQPCPRCKGSGETIESPCIACQGEGRVKKARKLTVKIPPGVDNGSVLRLKGEGEAGVRGAVTGDLYVVLEVAQDPVFQREGDDLYCKVPIAFTQAALGGEVSVPTLDKPVRMKVPPGTQSGKLFRLAGKGLPHLRYRGQGDEYVKVEVQVPVNLSAREKELLGELAQIRGEKV